ncbi:YD repeat-containing protein [Streptomyces cavourensis]|nr:YD repeat-containing protein [Streptomyces cavourensis]
MVRGGEIPDDAWAVIAPLLPPVGRARGRWRGITARCSRASCSSSAPGCPGGTPERFGPWQTVHGRFARCGPPTALGTVSWTPPGVGRRWTGWSRSTPQNHGLGRPHGGFTTKLHLAVEQGQKPMAIVVTAGQRGDSPQFEPVLARVRVPRLGPGRPRVRRNRVRADKAYSSRRNRAYLRRRGIRCTIPDKADQAHHRRKLGSRGGRPPHFDPVDYRERHTVNRLSSSTDQLGKTTTYAYDADGNLLSRTSPLGHKSSWTYDSDGRQATAVDPRGNATGADPAQYTTTYGYDPAGNPTKVTDPLGGVTTTAYDALGKVVERKDADGRTTSYGYDDLDQLTKVTAPTARSPPTVTTSSATSPNAPTPTATSPRTATTRHTASPRSPTRWNGRRPTRPTRRATSPGKPRPAAPPGTPTTRAVCSPRSTTRTPPLTRPSATTTPGS